MPKTLTIGDVLTVTIPERVPPGHEQEGQRPAIVVGLPDRLGNPRFPVVLIAPLTIYREQSWVEAAPERYPRLKQGTARLRSPSVVLLDQVLSVDIRRIEKRRGSLTTRQYAPIMAGLGRMCATKDEV